MKDLSIKLRLTVGLLNSKPEQGNAVQLAKRLMGSFKNEVGAFLGLKVVGDKYLDARHVLRTYALNFERYTLGLDVVLDPNGRQQVVQRLDLRSNAS